jgi:DNA helicase-2/ATP-dependent DNA helicase PcrA
MEEERRLCYVGITRAKEQVYLVRAFRRGYQGSGEPTLPSRFLLDIPAYLVTTPSQDAWERRQRVVSVLSPTPKAAFKTGDHVRHTVFGDGIVINCLPIKDDQEVTVAFKGKAGFKRLLLSLAPLERIE